MRVLVTGATGFLGSHIAEQLAAEGHAVRVLLRATSDRSFLAGFPWEEALEWNVSDISLASKTATSSGRCAFRASLSRSKFWISDFACLPARQGFWILK